MTDRARLQLLVDGYVQGVGFRYWVRQQARSAGLTGSARNLGDGRVEIVVEGPRADCEALLRAVRGGEGPGSVRDIGVSWLPAEGGSGFRVG
jgi:acylphosphatase